MSPRDNWTDELIAVLKGLNATGISRSQIAAELYRKTGASFTRNAIIGKLARLREGSPNKPRFNQAAKISRPKRTPVNVIHLMDAKRAAAVLPPAVPIADVSDAAAMRERVRVIASQGPLNASAPLHIPFIERTDLECGFICSPDGEPATVCGHRTMLLMHREPVERSSYCLIHHSFTHAGFGNDHRRERQRA